MWTRHKDLVEGKESKRCNKSTILQTLIQRNQNVVSVFYDEESPLCGGMYKIDYVFAFAVVQGKAGTTDEARGC